MKKNIKYAFYFVLFGIFAFVFSLPYLKATMAAMFSTGKLDSLGISLNQFLFGQGYSFTIEIFVLSLIGVSLAHKVGLKWDWIQAMFDKKDRPVLDRKAIGFSIISSVIICLVVFFIQYLFLPYMPEYKEAIEQIQPNIAWWAGITTIFQGGVMEEVMIRLGLMTLLIWLLSKIFARKKTTIPNWIYIFSVVFSSIVFGAGHLGMAKLLVGTLTLPLILFVILGNSLAGLLFGYLYWKKGLEYGIIGHITGDFTLHFLLPLILLLF